MSRRKLLPAARSRRVSGSINAMMTVIVSDAAVIR